MNLLNNLRQLDFIVTVIVNVVIFYLALPAYKRTKHKGFLFWILASLFALWNTVTLHTIGANPYTNPSGYHFVRYGYRILFVVDDILEIIGTVMIIQSYLCLFEATQKTSDLAANSKNPETPPS